MILLKSNLLHKFILASLACILFVWGLSELSNPMIAEGDAYSRAIISKEMIENGQVFQLTQTNVWLPLHFIVISLPSYLGLEIYFGQRLITLVLGIVSVISMYFFTKEITKNKNIALIASIFFAFFPLRFFLSTQTLSEGIFISIFLPALYFLIKENKNVFTDTSFIILYSLANLTRFESWYFIPVIIGYVILSKDFSKSKKLLYIFSTIISPLVWIIANAEAQGGLFSFFFEKLAIAQENPSPAFYDWNSSWQAWEKQLLLIFPAIFLVFWSTQLNRLSKQLTLKNLLLFLTPIYLFFILVIQVYFGTMEWFPIRYLLIPLTFIFPVLAMSTIHFGNFLILFMKNKNDLWKKIFLVAAAAILLFISYQSFVSAQNYAYKQLTVASFLSLPNANNITQDDFEKIHSFNSAKKFIQENISNSIEIDYFYSENNRSWQDQALFYQLKRSGRDLSKSDFDSSQNPNNIIIWEREPDKNEPYWQKRLKKLFENDHYYVVTLE